MQQRNVRYIQMFTGLLGLLCVASVNARPVCENPASDPDGDGFGWENNDTCIVVANTASQSSSGGLPDCRSADSDPDGDGFGWESNDSCRVVQVQSPVTNLTPAAAKPVCRSASSDSDGDGFGWENGASCVVLTRNSQSPVVPAITVVPEEKVTLAQPACSAERFRTSGGYGWENSRSCTFLNAGDGGRSITDVILVTGQSNALGSETIPFDPYDPELDSPVRRVYAHSSNGWGIAGLRQIWDHGWYPRTDIAGDPANNFAFHFGRRLVRLDADAVVGIIMVTAPGAGISFWDRDGDFYKEINRRVRSALAELPGNARVQGILWHQGETDFYSTNYYSDRLRNLIGNFRAEDWFAGDGVFVCGETLNSPVNERLSALNTDGDRRTGCVSADGLESIGDDIHFNAQSLRTLGARYAEEYQSLR